MNMDNQELEKLVDWATSKYFQDPPYVLRGGETVTADDNGAIYAVLTLKAALNDSTMRMTDSEVQKWVVEQVRDIYRDARTYEEAILDDESPDATDDFKAWAVKRIPMIDFSSYPTGELSGDYRFLAWFNDTLEDWWDFGEVEARESGDSSEF